MIYIVSCPNCYSNNLKKCQDNKFECNNCNKDFYTNELNYESIEIDNYQYF